MIDIGQNVFFLEPKTKSIKEGIVAGIFVTETGYKMINMIVSDNGEKKKVRLESAHVHATKELVEFHKDKVSSIIDEAGRIAEEANEKVDALRVQVIGQPIYKELAEDLMK